MLNRCLWENNINDAIYWVLFSKKGKMERKILLSPKDFRPSFPDWNIEGILNPAAIRLPDNKIALFVRMSESSKDTGKKSFTCPIIVSHDEYRTSNEIVRAGEIISRDSNVIYLKNGICRLTNISHFRKVILKKNGFDVDEISSFPDFTGIPEDGEYGVEDPRIVKIGRKYYMTYVSISGNEGVSSSLAESIDLKTWKRRGVIFREQNKDAVLFPEKIGGMYVALNRPEVFYEFHRPAIWISHSPDLVFWGREQSLLLPRENSWESNRIGAGAPPIKLDKGWLLFYHGVEVSSDNTYVYSAGTVLLDLKNPNKVIARTSKKKPLFTSSLDYEKMLDENKRVIFPTGVVPDLNGRDLLVYSGAGDRFTSVIKVGIDEVMNSMESV